VANAYEDSMTNQEWEMEVTLGQLNLRTWPEVLRRALLYGPMGMELRAIVAKGALDAVVALCKGNYTDLPLCHKLSLLRALVDAASSTVCRQCYQPSNIHL
jgi:hypothetical protein